MTETDQSTEKESSDDKFNPLSCMAVLLYYPALGFAIRLGFSMYGYLFDHLKGFAIIIGILITIIITIIYAFIAVFIVYLLIRLGEIVWGWIMRIKANKV